MDVSTFLAKLVGLYLLIVAILGVFRRKQMCQTAKEFVASKITLAVSAEISLIFGLVIAIDHSIWEWNWRGLVTVIGYILILKGIMRFAFPTQVKKWATHFMGSCCCWVCLLVTLIIGAYLTYAGFTQMPVVRMMGN